MKDSWYCQAVKKVMRNIIPPEAEVAYKCRKDHKLGKLSKIIKLGRLRMIVLFLLF